MAKIKTIDIRVIKAFENSSHEDIVKYLEWLRATIEVLSQNIRRTIGLALVLIAAFGLVNTSSNTVITVGSFKLSGGSIVAIFIPAIVSFLLYQAATDTNRLNILQEAFSKVFSIWSPAGENNDVDLWVLPSYALYWNVSTFSERRLFRTLPDTLQSLLEDIIFAVVVIGM
jgi:hypothetical protein